MKDVHRVGYPGLHGYSEIVAQAQFDEAVAARIVVDILPVDAEQDNRLQVQRPAVRETPVQSEGQRMGGPSQVTDKTGCYFGTLDIIERQVRGREEFVFKCAG